MKLLKAVAVLVVLVVAAIAAWIWNDVARIRSQIARSRDSHYSDRIRDAFIAAESPRALLASMAGAPRIVPPDRVDALRERLVVEVIDAITTDRQVVHALLDTVYLGKAGGESLYGLPAGARGYFSKSPDKLTVAEAATLAGIVRSPFRYSPLEHPVPALERRKVVLERMRAFKFITDKEFATAVSAPLLK